MLAPLSLSRLTRRPPLHNQRCAMRNFVSGSVISQLPVVWFMQLHDTDDPTVSARSARKRRRGGTVDPCAEKKAAGEVS